MSVYTESVAKRREVILNTLREPLPLSRLKLTLIDEHSLELTDTTIRRDLKALKDLGLITLTGAMVNREPVFVASTGFTMPLIWNPITSKYLSPITIQEALTRKACTFSPDHMVTLERSINRLLNDARKMQDGSATDVQEDLDAIKANCTKSLSYLLVYSKMIEQLLMQKVWWSSKTIANITEDASFNPTEVWENFSKIE